jgi:hypothetical protein
MTKKMIRDKKPSPVSDEVVEAMDVRLAYKNLIEAFVEDQTDLEQRIVSQKPNSPDPTHAEPDSPASGSHAPKTDGSGS